RRRLWLPLMERLLLLLNPHPYLFFFFFSSRRRHTRSLRDWSSDVCSSDLRARADAAKEDLYIRWVRLDPGGGEHHQPLVDWVARSEERRVGKECRSRWSPYH